MKKIFVFIFMVSGGFFYSCTKDMFDIKPKGEASIETFSSKQGVKALLIGAYAVVDGTVNASNSGVGASSVSNWMFGSVVGADAYKGSEVNGEPDANPIEGFYANATNPYLQARWTNYYDGITRANDVLKVIPLALDMTDEERKQAEAQARFLRAHFYFELTIVFGKIPYIDENTKNPTEVANDHVVWPEMETDMKFAVDNLPGRWSDKGRVTQWAAKMYLARIYMFQQKFADAKPLLEDVYINGGFSLAPSYEMNYMIENNNNTESIWEIQYAVNDGARMSSNAGNGDGWNYPNAVAGLGTCCGGFQPSHHLVSLFKVNTEGLPFINNTYSPDDILPYSPTGANVSYTGPVDPRLDWAVGRPGVPYLDWGIHKGNAWNLDPVYSGPYINKKTMFKKSEKGVFSNTVGWRSGLNANNFRKFRLSHVILWLAECDAEAGLLHDATLLVNQVRNRAKKSNVVRFDDGTPAANYVVEPYTDDFPSKDYALKAIRYEDALEFSMEGLRFFDLNRWGIAASEINNYLSVESTVIPHLKGRVFTSGQNEVWPIPQREIDLSVKDGKSVLTQNPGY